MKFTQYFLYTRIRKYRSSIKDEWILRAIDKPLWTKIQSDGRICCWVWIDEVRKYLRVIILEDGLTIHNAFFDRNFKGKVNEN